MRLVIAPDSFKGTLTPSAAARAMGEGARRALPGAEILLVPMADGGDGALDALAQALPLSLRDATATDPLGRAITSRFGLLDDGTAILESAQAIGLALVDPRARDPLRAGSWGVGDLLLASAAAGARHCIVTLGGSATVDGGTGMAARLGWQHRDARGQLLSGCGAELEQIESVAPPERPPAIPPCTAWVDVDSPLVGPEGAAPVFGPQKGADPAAVGRLGRGLERLAQAWERAAARDLRWLPGAGAAGGLGAGLAFYLDARLVSGAEALFELVQLDARLRDADLVITGEGRLDATSFRGKLIGRLCRHAADAGVPVLVVAGDAAPGTRLPPDFAGQVTLAPTLAERWGSERACREAAECLAEATRAALAQGGARRAAGPPGPP